MSAIIIADELEVCTDCAMISANGELGQGDDEQDRRHARRMARQWPDGDVVLSGSGDDDVVPFSTRRCDGCGDELAGERHPAVVFARGVPTC